MDIAESQPVESELKDSGVIHGDDCAIASPTQPHQNELMGHNEAQAIKFNGLPDRAPVQIDQDIAVVPRMDDNNLQLESGNNCTAASPDVERQVSNIRLHELGAGNKYPQELDNGNGRG